MPIVPKWVPPMTVLQLFPLQAGQPSGCGCHGQHCRVPGGPGWASVRTCGCPPLALKPALIHRPHLCTVQALPRLPRLQDLPQGQLPTRGGQDSVAWPLLSRLRVRQKPQGCAGPWQVGQWGNEAHLLPGAPIWERGSLPKPKRQCQAPSVPTDCLNHRHPLAW